MPYESSPTAIANRRRLGGQRGHLICRLCATLLAICGMLVAPRAKATSPYGFDDAGVVAHALSVVNAQNAGLMRQNGQPTIQYSVGTGAINDPSGLIVTNQHVIQNAIAIRVTFQDKTQVPARLVAAVSFVDVALLKVEVSRPLPTIAFGNSDALRVGEPVIALGNPIGVGTSVSRGGMTMQAMVTGNPRPDFGMLQSQVVPSRTEVAQAMTFAMRLHVVTITGADRQRFSLGNVQRLLIDRVDAGMQGADVGPKPGDVIHQMGNETSFDTAAGHDAVGLRRVGRT